MWFDTKDLPPLLVENFPFDKYELEPSPLTQFILQRRNSNVCWQVVTASQNLVVVSEAVSEAVSASIQVELIIELFQSLEQVELIMERTCIASRVFTQEGLIIE